MAGVLHDKVEMAARNLERVEDASTGERREPKKRREHIDTPRRPVPPMA